MHSPEAWGTSSAPLSDLEWANLKAQIYKQVSGQTGVTIGALMVQHFSKEAPFITSAVLELQAEGVISVELNNGLKITR